MKAKLIAAACGFALIATTTSAQVPANIAEKVRAAGQKMDDSTRPLYEALFPKEPWPGQTEQLDIAYGPDPLEKLDVYAPANAQGKKLPVMLFVHGGGFTRGDKRGGFYPQNITEWAAKNGMVGVDINYRLSPAVPWPGGIKDLVSAIAWTKANIAKYGGDPDHIVLFGHSAGANHVADYAAHPEVRGAEASSVKGVIMLSPAYAADAAGAKQPYYGTDVDAQVVAKQADRLRDGPFPLFIGYAEFDPPPMKSTAAALLAGICKAPARCPKSVEIKDSNHFTEGEALGTDDQQLAGPLLQWMRTLKR